LDGTLTALPSLKRNSSDVEIPESDPAKNYFSWLREATRLMPRRDQRDPAGEQNVCCARMQVFDERGEGDGDVSCWHKDGLQAEGQASAPPRAIHDCLSLLRFAKRSRAWQKKRTGQLVDCAAEEPILSSAWRPSCANRRHLRLPRHARQNCTRADTFWFACRIALIRAASAASLPLTMKNSSCPDRLRYLNIEGILFQRRPVPWRSIQIKKTPLSSALLLHFLCFLCGPSAPSHRLLRCGFCIPDAIMGALSLRALAPHFLQCTSTLPRAPATTQQAERCRHPLNTCAPRESWRVHPPQLPTSAPARAQAQLKPK